MTHAPVLCNGGSLLLARAALAPLITRAGIAASASIRRRSTEPASEGSRSGAAAADLGVQAVYSTPRGAQRQSGYAAGTPRNANYQAVLWAHGKQWRCASHCDPRRDLLRAKILRIFF